MSGVFYNNPRFQQQRGPPTQSSIQRILDENASLIQTIIEHQKRGAMAEVYDYEQVLHRNLVYLTQLADPSVHSQGALPPPQLTSNVNGTSGTNPVRLPNSISQMTAPNQPPRPQQGAPTNYSPIENQSRPGIPPNSQPGPNLSQVSAAQASQMSYRPVHSAPSNQQTYQPGQSGQFYSGQQAPQYSQAGPGSMARPGPGGPGGGPQMPPQGVPQMMRHPQPQFNQPRSNMYQPAQSMVPQQNGPMNPMQSLQQGMQQGLQQGMPPHSQGGGGPPQPMQMPPTSAYQQSFSNQ